MIRRRIRRTDHLDTCADIAIRSIRQAFGVCAANDVVVNVANDMHRKAHFDPPSLEPVCRVRRYDHMSVHRWLQRRA